MAIHEYAFLGKEFLKYEDAKVPVMTHAFMYGTAVFEGIRAYWNDQKQKLYLLQARPHLERMMQSCKIMRMAPYYNVDEMLKLTIELLQRNQPRQDAYVRPSWFKASERIGPILITGDGSPDKDSFVLTSIDMGAYVASKEAGGISVCVTAWRRLSDNAIPARAKVNGAYVNTALAKTDAVLAGFQEAIFLTEEGHVAEGSAMNLFIVRNGKLITSGITENILEGITRKFIIQLAQEEFSYEVETRQIDRTELYVADEAFFVGTGAQVAPITKIDNYQVGDGKIGPITTKLMNTYYDVCRGNNEKYADQVIEIDYAKITA